MRTFETWIRLAAQMFKGANGGVLPNESLFTGENQRMTAIYIQHFIETRQAETLSHRPRQTGRLRHRAKNLQQPRRAGADGGKYFGELKCGSGRPADVLPGIDAAKITALQTAADAYQAVQTNQSGAQGATTTARIPLPPTLACAQNFSSRMTG